jgi:hypothetical protein
MKRYLSKGDSGLGTFRGCCVLKDDLAVRKTGNDIDLKGRNQRQRVVCDHTSETALVGIDSVFQNGLLLEQRSTCNGDL